MVRCLEFYQKLEKDGNFCGLSGPSLSNIRFYKEVVNTLFTRSGIDPEFTIVNFSEGASRPLHKIKNDEDLLERVLDNIAGRLKVGGSISTGDVRDWIETANEDASLRSAAPGGTRPKELSIDDLRDPGPTRLSDKMQTPPAGWHPSTNGCYGCLLLGYARDEGRKTPYHICCEAGRPPFGMEECPLGTGPIRKVDCEHWGEDTLCHATADTLCDPAKMKRVHCPIAHPEALELIRRQAGRNPQNGRLTTEYCKLRDCKDLKKREMNNTLECAISGMVPGNMMECPKNGSGAGKFDKYLPQGNSPEIELDEKPNSNSTPGELWEEYTKKYPEPADCRESGCLKIKKIRQDLHICEITGMRPENMLGKFPVGCYKRKPESTEEDDDTPGYQEFLNRQLPQCRKRKCPNLVDEEGDVMADCKVMARREDEGKPWRRNGCPLRPEIPPPKAKGTGKPKPVITALVGRDTVQVIQSTDPRVSVDKEPRPAGSLPIPQQREFLVVVGREDLGTLQQLIDHGDVDKIEEAAQIAFDAGIQILQERLELRDQRDAARGEA